MTAAAGSAVDRHRQQGHRRSHHQAIPYYRTHHQSVGEADTRRSIEIIEIRFRGSDRQPPPAGSAVPQLDKTLVKS
jgi:hypothetical protein